jgi:hypothetical protein
MERLDLSTVPREDLEQFAAESVEKLQRLESSVQQLESQLNVDPDVIDGWRSWVETIDEERKKWSDLATRLDRDNKSRKTENARLFQAVKDLTIVLERIHSIAGRSRGDKVRMLDLKRAVDSIHEQAGAAMADAYEDVLGYPEDLNAEHLHALARQDRLAAFGGAGYAIDPPELPSYDDDQQQRPEDATDMETP